MRNMMVKYGLYEHAAQLQGTGAQVKDDPLPQAGG